MSRPASQPPTSTPQLQYLNTDVVAPRERPHLWSTWVNDQFGGLQSDLYGDQDFSGQLWNAQAGELQLTRLEANRHRVIRSAEQARRSDEAPFKIVAPLVGQASVEQAGRQVTVNAHSWTVYDTASSYLVANPQRVEHLVLMIPRAQLTGCGLRPDTFTARRIDSSSGIARVALGTMRSTFNELRHMSADAARGAGEMVTQLVRLSLRELTGHSTPRTQRETLKDRIRQHVAAHLRDPSLGPDHIARALNCSKRLLYTAFTDEACTLAAYIQQQRLEACLRELQRPAASQRTILEIALHWGFNNPSHFSRIFKEHTGHRPSDYLQGRAR